MMATALTIIMGVWLVGFILLAMSCNGLLKQRDEEREKNTNLEKSGLHTWALYNSLRDDFNKLKEKYEKLEFEYDLQKSENVRLAYIIGRISRIAKTKYPEIAAFLERMRLLREQSIKDMMEKLRGKEKAKAKSENESITH